MPRSPRLLVLAAVLVLATLSTPAFAATSASSSSSAESKIVDLINARRAEEGLPALTPRADLHEAARSRTFDHAEQGFQEHKPYSQSEVCCLMGFGEILAYVSGHGESGSSSLANALMGQWRGSGSHDSVMTKESFDQIGVGVVVDSDGRVWGTAIFRICDGSSGCSGGAQSPAGNTSRSWGKPAPAPEPEPKPAPKVAPKPKPEPAPAPAPKPKVAPKPAPKPEPAPAPKPEPTPEPTPTPEPEPEPTPEPIVPPSYPLARTPEASGIGPKTTPVTRKPVSTPVRMAAATAPMTPAPATPGPSPLMAALILAGLLASGTIITRPLRR